jgi:hypothetical protein
MKADTNTRNIYYVNFSAVIPKGSFTIIINIFTSVQRMVSLCKLVKMLIIVNDP